jgi:hypothetical protein
MLVEQLAGAGFNALIFNYAVKAFNAGPSIITAALTTFTLGSAAMPGILLPVCDTSSIHFDCVVLLSF